MAASQPANFNVQEFTDAGQPLAGGMLYTYAQGTTTQKVAYTDPAGAIPQTYTADGAGGQYIALNARGELPAPLYLATGSYDLTLKRADGSTVWTRQADGVGAGSSGASFIGYAGTTLDALLKNQIGAVIASISALRAIDKTKYTQACVTGYYAAGDGGGGLYYYDSSDTTSADNGGTIIVASDGGRWKLSYQGYISVKQFGAKGDNTADDTTSFQAAVSFASSAKIELYIPSGTYRLTSTTTIPAGIRITGEGGAVQMAPVLMAVGGIAIFTAGSGFASESASFEHLCFDSATAGTGTGLAAGTTSYISQTTFRNCVFKSNLSYGINGPIILCSFYDCDFGSYPGTTQAFTAIRSSGTTGSYEPNANTFHKCVFRKSNAAYQIDVETSGVQWNFYGCDFEQNACTLSIIRYDAAGAISFFGGYIESNTTPYFLRVYGSLATAFCQVVRLHGVQVNNPATTAILKREIAYPYFDIQGCYGPLNCHVMQNDSGLFDQGTDLEACFGNYFVAGTGSFGELATVNTTTGYNARTFRSKSLNADAATFNQVNAVQKLAISVTAATAIATLSNPLSSASPNWSGQVLVTAMSGSTLTLGTAANTSSYILNVSNGGVTACTSVSSAGVTGGAAANQPSFTWSINGSSQLVATPIGSTSGTFSFIVSTVGLVKAA